MRTNFMPFSICGVPAIGLLGLLVCLWHPQVNLQAAATGSETAYLISPDSRLDPSMSVFLRAEAKNVDYSRKHDPLAAQAKAVEDYNLVAQECTPAVFQMTHLPTAFAL